MRRDLRFAAILPLLDDLQLDILEPAVLSVVLQPDVFLSRMVFPGDVKLRVILGSGSHSFQSLVSHRLDKS